MGGGAGDEAHFHAHEQAQGEGHGVGHKVQFWNRMRDMRVKGELVGKKRVQNEFGKSFEYEFRLSLL